MRSIWLILKSVSVFTGLIFTMVIYNNDSHKLTKAGVRFRKYFEEVGGIFTKFGQILALRRDIFPDEICGELRKLLDEVPTFPFEIVEKIVLSETGKNIGEIFTELDNTPIASASLGQVYKGKLKTGESVVLKVLRPGIEEKVGSDLNLMLLVASLVDLVPFVRIRLKPLAEEFKDWIYEEIDYKNEANNLKEFYSYKTDLLPVFNIPVKSNIPKLYEDFSTSKIIIMEFVEGINVNKLITIANKKDSEEYKKIIEMGYDLNEIGRKIRLMTMKQAFIDGLFNADPHPANIIATPENEIYFIDFGLVGRLNKKQKVANFRFARSLSMLDREAAFDAFKIVMDTSKARNERLVRKAIDDLFDTLEKVRGKDIVKYSETSTTAMYKLLRSLNEANIQIPREIVKAFRAMVTGDGIVHALNPDIEFNEATRDLYRVTLAATYLEFKESLNTETISKMVMKGINLFEKEIVL